MQYLIVSIYSLAALASVCANNGAFIPSQSSSISSTSSPTASPVHLLSPHTIKKMTRKYDSYEVDQVIGTIMPFTHGLVSLYLSIPLPLPLSLPLPFFFPPSLLLDSSLIFLCRGFASFTAKGQPDCYGWGGAGGVCVRFFPELNLSLAYPPPLLLLLCSSSYLLSSLLFSSFDIFDFQQRYVTNRMGIKMSFNDPRSSILITAALECAKNAQNKSLAP